MMQPQPRPLGLAAAVATYNRTARELDIARRLLHQAMRNEALVAPRRRTNAACGTEGGYRKHRRADEPPCPACAEAHNVATKRRSAQRAA